MGRALDPLDLFCVSTERHLALCPVLRTFLTRWSALHDDDAGFRARCAQLVELVTAAQATAEHRATRLFMVLDWALRRTTATWLALAGLDVQATAWSRRAPLGSWEDLTALAPYLAESRARASVHGLQAERGRIVDEAQLTRAVALVGKASGWHAAWAAINAASLEGRGATVSAAWFDAWCAVA
ncbi:MAG: hypothetical protein KC635_25695, partial [Myxococcales bacterium]|nr:hypothetical protein [Myxococcales bacterium]